MSHIRLGFDVKILGLRAALFMAWEAASGLKLKTLWSNKNDPFMDHEQRLATPRVETWIGYQGKGTALIYDGSKGGYRSDEGEICPFPNGIFARRERAHGHRDVAVLPQEQRTFPTPH